MARVYETLRRGRVTYVNGNVTRYVIRLWMQGTDPHYAEAAMALAVDLAEKQPSTLDAAEVIVNSIEGVNAVEVLDGELNGSLIYPEWP